MDGRRARRRTTSCPVAIASAQTIDSRRKRTASSAQPIGMMTSTIQVGISSTVGLNEPRVKAIQVVVAPNTVSTMATPSADQVAEERADALPEFRHRLHGHVDIDMCAARHGPRRAEEGDVDQGVFDDLDSADDRAVEHVAQRHIDADQRADMRPGPR